MSHNYVVTAFHPQKVVSTCLARFITTGRRNLLVARVSHLDVYDIGTQGLTLVVRIPFNARISSIHRFGRATNEQDTVLVVTNRFRVALLIWDSNLCQCTTLFVSDHREDTSLPDASTQNPIFICDPMTRCIALAPGSNIIRIIPVSFVPSATASAPPTAVDVASQLPAARDGANIAPESAAPKPAASDTLQAAATTKNTRGTRASSSRHVFPNVASATVADISSITARLASSLPSFLVRLPDDSIIDAVFLHGCRRPTIAALCIDSSNMVHLRSYAISFHDQIISPAALSKDNLDANLSTKLIAMPEPYGGVIVVADLSVTYYPVGGSPVHETILDPNVIKVITQVDADGSRYLLSDQDGKLLMLSLDLDRVRHLVRALQIDFLGETSIASAISYLDKGFVFIGSEAGDSQLIRLVDDRDPSAKSLTELVHSYPHIGPITDFCVVQESGSRRHGQGQIVTCSGIWKDGSLRVVRNGIGITEQAAVELPGIKDLWSLRRNFSDRYHSFLVQSFAFETRILEVGSDELSEIQLPGVDTQSTTLFMANVVGDMIIQVTGAGIRALDCSKMGETSGTVWQPDPQDRISVASGNASQLILATTSGSIVYLEVDSLSKSILKKASVQSDREICCLNCNPFGMLHANGCSVSTTSSLAVIGLWPDEKSPPAVRLISLPTLTPLYNVALDGDVMARSVMMATLGNQDYIFIALGDGYILSYSYAASNTESIPTTDSATSTTSILHPRPEHSQPTGQSHPDNASLTAVAREGVHMMTDNDFVSDVSHCVLKDRRRWNIGTQPAALSLFSSHGANHVFVACDRPSVLYADRAGGKLLMSNVNLEQLTCVCAFDSEAAPESLAIATGTALRIGAVDDIQKLHIQTIPLGMQPRRIRHVESARAFVVLAEMSRTDSNGEEIVDSFLLLIDDYTFDIVFQEKMPEREIASSITSTTLEGEGIDPKIEYCVVGTCIGAFYESEISEGRILLYSIVSRRLVQVAEHSVCGAVYDIVPFNGRILAGVNMVAVVLSVKQGNDGVLKMKQDISHRGHILIWRIRSKGDFVVVADLMRSVTLLSRRTIGSDGFDTLARDFDNAWTTALDIMEDDTFIVAEHGSNLLTLRRNSSSPVDSDRMKLERVGQYHIGAFVNRIESGSLVMQLTDDSASSVLKTKIFGTADGMLGLIVSLKPEAFEFFRNVEKAVVSVSPGVAGFRHEEWRQFFVESPLRKAPVKGFVDGDMVESFLELSKEQASRVADTVGVSVEELTRRIEEMHRLH